MRNSIHYTCTIEAWPNDRDPSFPALPGGMIFIHCVVVATETHPWELHTDNKNNSNAIKMIYKNRPKCEIRCILVDYFSVNLLNCLFCTLFVHEPWKRARCWPFSSPPMINKQAALDHKSDARNWPRLIKRQPIAEMKGDGGG